MISIGTVFSGIGAPEHALKRLGIDHSIAFACDNGDVDIFGSRPGETIGEIEASLAECAAKMASVKHVPDELSVQWDEIERAQGQLHCRIAENFEAGQLTRLYDDTGEKERLQRKRLRELSHLVGMQRERLGVYEVHAALLQLNSPASRKAYVDALYEPYVSRNKVRASYLANYSIAPEHYHWNACFLDGRGYRGGVDLLVGGSPCQSFSFVGAQRGLDDTRGTLFYEFARLIDEVQPKAFIYENVRGLVNHDGGRTWKGMSGVFHALGYDWKWAVLNAKDYGIPQSRERLFAVGFRKDIPAESEFQFPAPRPLECTMQDFLLDKVSGMYYLPAKGVEFVTAEKNLKKRYTQIDGEVQLCQKKNQQFNWHGDFVFTAEAEAPDKVAEHLEKYFLSEKVRKYVLASGTKGFYSKPETDLEVARPLLTTMHKMHRAGVDNYVTTAGRLRKLTPRECLRLMGFGDDFRIVVSDTTMYQQAGNSMVVNVLMAVITAMLESRPSLMSDNGGYNHNKGIAI